MKTVLVTSSTGEPITLEELKNHIRIMPGETEDEGNTGEQRNRGETHGGR